MAEANAEIHNFWSDTEDKAPEAENIIAFLQKVEEGKLPGLGIGNRTDMIVAVRRVLRKQELMFTLLEKVRVFEEAYREFKAAFDPLIKMGLPSPGSGYGETYLEWNIYLPMLTSIRDNTSRFEEEKQAITGNRFVDSLLADLTILALLRAIYMERSTISYEKVTELDIALRNLNNCSYPKAKEWEKYRQYQLSTRVQETPGEPPIKFVIQPRNTEAGSSKQAPRGHSRSKK